MHFVCWKCGTSVAALPLPLSRLAECANCRAYLHACRMCKFHDPRLTGQCQEERAEEVRDKEQANFCDWFKPRPDAHRYPDEAKSRAAKDKIDFLFGEPASDSPGKSRMTQAQLDELFASNRKPRK